MTTAISSTAFPHSARIYYVNPLLLSGRDRWLEIFDHAAFLGFDTVLSAPPFQRTGESLFSPHEYASLDPALSLSGNAEEALAMLAGEADARGINLTLDLAVSAVAEWSDQARLSLDPRRSPLTPFRAPASSASPGLIDAWQKRLSRLAAAGIAGYRLVGLDLLEISEWQQLIAAARTANPSTAFLAYTPGTDFALRTSLRDCGLDATFTSLAWWDLRESWILEEYRLQRPLGPQIAFPEPPFGKRLAHGTESREIRERRSRRALRLAVEIGDGLLVPMGFEFGAVLPLDPTQGHGEGLRRLRAEGIFDLTRELRDLLAARGNTAKQLVNCEIANQVTVISQADVADIRSARSVQLLAVNRDLRRSALLPDTILNRAVAPFVPVDAATSYLRLKPGETRLIKTQARAAITAERGDLPLDQATSSPRIAIEKVAPAVDDGRFPIKRIVGETVVVEADIFADGHDLLSAALLFRPRGQEVWREARMSLFENDRWKGSFVLDRVGRFEFCVEAWKNPFAIFRYELVKKHEARLDLSLEIIEGEELIRGAAADPAAAMAAAERSELEALLRELERREGATKLDILLAPHTAELMARADQRPFACRTSVYGVESERREAGFSSWYQIFPRSQSGDPNRHGTFDDVIPRLPAIRDMGFDVLYFPPIHPIGRTNRKGRNNSLAAAPNDPGSPYAIGSEAGGHEAIHPELGEFDDFERLVDEARKVGLEIALDLAIQASPDHPWLREHPGWFDWRPDGTIRYAENPPKKYEDIVNVDFYAKDAIPDLWVELRDIVEMWVDEGVRLFRVDNPHTKPFPFWEWLIGDIRARHPDVIFLSEAFTRPKVMYRLAKIGFSQSYTYFTWRNERWELEQYMSELTASEVREFFRPHFFVNTHDINPDFLQNAPRPAFVIRAALAATLSGLWGVYNGFELCEGRPDAKRKEYADSEKYEIRAWDYDRPGNIKAEIAMLNRIRRDNPALHSHLGLTLLPSSNSNVMFFEKADADRHNVLLIAVTLNPHGIEESGVEFPLWKFGLADTSALALEDLVSGQNFKRTGKWQTIRLDPAHLPFAIWRVRVGEA
ncbi:alpha-1,4-glucan--maltose-1-phosphate maltosyltransferase [Rhizobium mesosinicum]|uniref:Alpha-1,4-glucan:maltose-1-phosphate maltosyltransferase n=1 Tax=Rhizobium mesosinicum TaxID=335017 RepID=A0ABS7GXA4_9HYPH|nr:alpha-1,4-glucan--maltose-1-phosphate maltosyltransferase [Rhizobium mesosinicum]MBW9054589.1 alpha-1,4-glucan--maltose-1-phosphate maltosyltransferase [Rhizobium mesosinicum]